VKHNALIAFIMASLSQGSMDQTEFEMLLGEADESRIRFVTWYDGPARNEGIAECASCGVAVEAIANIADITLRVIELQNQLAVQQREEFHRQLLACEWVPWAELKPST
jgi:hypothetical protein